MARAIQAAQAYLREHRDEARYTDSPAMATLRNGLRCDVTGPDGAAITTDMPASVGGSGAAPSPGWFMRAAEASCVATLLAMRAAMLDIPVTDLEVTVDSESDDYGILDIAPDVPAGPLSTSIRVRAAGVNQEQLREMAGWAVAHCPVTDAVARTVPIHLAVATT